MGTAYLARRELLASQAEYERALQLQPANALAHANLVYLRTKLCDWTGRRRRPAPGLSRLPPLPSPPAWTPPPLELHGHPSPSSLRAVLPTLLAYTY